MKAHGCVDEKGYAVRAGQVGERKNLFSKDQQNRKFQMQLQEKEEQIANITALCTKYDIKRIKGKLIQKIHTKLQDLNTQTADQTAVVERSESVLEKARREHQKCADAEKEDVVEMALKLYKSHLNVVISSDILALGSKKEKLETMLQNLTADQEQEVVAQADAAAVLEELEQADTRGRKTQRLQERCHFLQDEVEGLCREYTMY